MPADSSYVLIAVSNLARATAFRNAVSDSVRHDIALVRDGEDALQEMGRRGLPALLLIDLSLPRVDGFAVIRKVRRQASERETRIVAVAGHESLRAAARELSAPLAISAILPLDVDHDMLRSMLVEEFHGLQPASAGRGPDGGFAAGAPLGVADIMNRAAREARRRSHLPLSVGYVIVDQEEDFSLHASASASEPTVGIGDITAFRFLRQVAESSDSLVIPNVETHPVFAALLLNGAHPVRGFAAVPVETTQPNLHAALAVVSGKPLTLGASDLDALVALGREAGREIDRIVAGVPAPKHQAGSKLAENVNVEELRALQQLAATDPLTGLANRRGGEKYIANEISRSKRERRPLSCILLDVDRFKQVNDTYGHQAGDQLLRDLSNVLRRTVRAYDILVRWGGEEFLLVLPGVDLEMARMLAERVRVAAEALDTHGIGPVTISAGVASFEPDYDFTATLRTADQRLYQAKAGGRNKVV